MKPGPLYARVMAVCEELMKFALLTRDRADYLVDRYSERREREPKRLKAVAAAGRHLLSVTGRVGLAHLEQRARTELRRRLGRR